jgi:tol-pal system protein YbgF
LKTCSLIGCILYLYLPGSFAQAPVSQTQATINQRLERVEQLLQNQGLLDMLQQLDSMQQEISRLRGEIELQNNTIDQMQKRQRALYTDIDQRFQNMENPGGSRTTLQPETTMSDPGNPPLQTLSPVYGPDQSMMNQRPSTPLSVENMDSNWQADMDLPQSGDPASANTADAPDIALQTTRSVTETTTMPLMIPDTADGTAQSRDVVEPVIVNPELVRADYDQAFSLLTQAQYDQAILAFRSFLAKYPVSEFSDNAQYWLGESFYVMRQFEAAIGEYENLINNYPDSQKFTHALLKIGYSYQELGIIAEARQYLEMLTRQYPETTASRLAQSRLQQIAIMEQQQTTPAN